MIYESPKIVTGWLAHGDLLYFKSDNSYWVVLSYEGMEDYFNVECGRVYIDKSFSCIKDTETQVFDSDEKIDVVGKMFLWPDGNYHHHTMDDCQAPSPPQTHAAVLPTDHPLREVAYWNAPGGKNLTIIHCLEWALKHLTIEDEKLPCQENTQARWRLMEALQAQQTRQKLRQEQGVLGTMNAHKSHDLSL